jgi:hypothetical protein
MRLVAADAELRARLRLAGGRVAGRFRWQDTARLHRSLYRRLTVRASAR